jgi:hypothetical protein
MSYILYTFEEAYNFKVLIYHFNFAFDKIIKRVLKSIMILGRDVSEEDNVNLFFKRYFERF